MKLALITPSYARDYELCVDLVQSVRRHAIGDVEHHIIVPRADLELFESLSSASTHIRPVAGFLPKSMVKMPRSNLWFNARRPFPPIRGWIAQQLVKLSAVAASDAKLAVVIDSDLVMVRDFGIADFQRGDRTIMFQKVGAINRMNLPRHVAWHRVSRELLGLNPDESDSYTDYICWPCAWEPAICRSLLQHLDEIGTSSWQTQIASRLHFSEMILYGVYVDEISDPGASRIARTDDMRTVAYDAERPMSLTDIHRFLQQVSDQHLAVMISAKSGTNPYTRRRALLEWEESKS